MLANLAGWLKTAGYSPSIFMLLAWACGTFPDMLITYFFIVLICFPLQFFHSGLRNNDQRGNNKYDLPFLLHIVCTTKLSGRDDKARPNLKPGNLNIDEAG